MVLCLAIAVDAWKDAGPSESPLLVVSVAFVVFGILGVLFGSLTVTIREDALEIRFGPGLFRKRFFLKDIESCLVVKNRWYHGWGIHSTRHGMLYNVSGLNAVEIKMRTGKKYRIGTDVPRDLEKAILESLGSVTP